MTTMKLKELDGTNYFLDVDFGRHYDYKLTLFESDEPYKAELGTGRKGPSVYVNIEDIQSNSLGYYVTDLIEKDKAQIALGVYEREEA